MAHLTRGCEARLAWRGRWIGWRCIAIGLTSMVTSMRPTTGCSAAAPMRVSPTWCMSYATSGCTAPTRSCHRSSSRSKYHAHRQMTGDLERFFFLRPARYSRILQAILDAPPWIVRLPTRYNAVLKRSNACGGAQQHIGLLFQTKLLGDIPSTKLYSMMNHFVPRSFPFECSTWAGGRRRAPSDTYSMFTLWHAENNLAMPKPSYFAFWIWERYGGNTLQVAHHRSATAAQL